MPSLGTDYPRPLHLMSSGEPGQTSCLTSISGVSLEYAIIVWFVEPTNAPGHPQTLLIHAQVTAISSLQKEIDISEHVDFLKLISALVVDSGVNVNDSHSVLDHVSNQPFNVSAYSIKIGA